MIDENLILKQCELVQQNLVYRGDSTSAHEVKDIILKRKASQRELERLLQERNECSQTIRDLTGAAREEAITYVRELKDTISEHNTTHATIVEKAQEAVLGLPNMIADGVPRSANKNDKDIWRIWGEQKDCLDDHLTIVENNGLVDFKNGTKIAGSGFPLYKGKGARLEWGLINFMLDKAFDKGFEFFLPPIVNNTASLTAAGNLPKFADEIYSTTDEMHLIPTAEVPITNYFRGETLSETDLPARIVSFSPCFRREAGAYGRMSKGLMRLHQFNKVETYVVCTPEQAAAEYEMLIANGEEILQDLGLSYRIANLPSCDLANQAAQTVDIEIWLPKLGDFSEVSSASNCTDYQARRANIKTDKKRFANTLNCSALATPRVMIALLETYQDGDSIIIPEALRPYVGCEKL